MRRLAIAFAVFSCPAAVVAEGYTLGDLVVSQPIAKTTPPSAMAGAGYLSIMNTGDEADSLISVEANFPRVEMHDTKVEDDIATMFQVEGIEIAPGEKITFMPGGKHIMFMGLNGDPFEEGEEIPGTLVFENAGTLDVMFQVQTLEAIMESLGGHAGAHGGH